MQRRRTDSEPQDDLEKLVRHATIVVDTNVLLELYRLSVPAREEALAVLESVRTRLWVPYQVSEEFRRNVDGVRGELSAAYQKSRAAMVKASNEAKAAFGASRRWNDSRVGVADLVDKIMAEFGEGFDALERADAAIVESNDDPVLRRINALLAGSVGAEPDPALVRERVEEFVAWRAPNKIPPGWKDSPAKHTPLLQAGDYLLWSELLDKAERTPTPFLLVTNDQKEDWFAKDDRPLPALMAEFRRRSGYKYGQVNLNDLLELARTELGADVTDTTLEEVVEELAPVTNAEIVDTGEVIFDERGARRTEELFAKTSTRYKKYDRYFMFSLLSLAMRSLNLTDRAIVSMHFLEGDTLGELAATLGVSQQEALLLRGKAIERLRVKLEEITDVL